MASCLVSLFTTSQRPTNESCRHLHWKFPPTAKYQYPPYFAPGTGHFPCFMRHFHKGRQVKHLPRCVITYNVTKGNTSSGLNTSMFDHVLIAQTNVWWYYNQTILHTVLPLGWTATLSYCSCRLF